VIYDAVDMNFLRILKLHAFFSFSFFIAVFLSPDLDDDVGNDDVE